MYDSNNSAMTNERSSPKLSPSTHRGNNKQSMSADKNKNQSQQDQRQRLDSTDSIGIMQMCHDDAVTAMKMLNSVGDNNDVTMIEEHEDNNVVNGAETGVDDNSAIIVVPEPFSSEGLKVQIDVVEYWCDMLLHSDSDAPVATAAAEESETEDAGYGHGKKRRKKHKRDETITLESSMSSLRKTIGRARELNRSLQLLPGSKGYGRLFNRLQISSLVGEVCISSPLFAEQEQDFSKLLVDEENEPLCDWSTERWIQTREKIILLKSRLLRRDANTLVMLTSYSHINETTDDQQLLSQKDDTLDERLGQQSMFTDEYRSLLKLLDVHIIISKFRNSLKTLWKDASKKENKISSGSHNDDDDNYFTRPILVGYAFGPKKMSTMGVVMAEASQTLLSTVVTATLPPKKSPATTNTAKKPALSSSCPSLTTVATTKTATTPTAPATAPATGNLGGGCNNNKKQRTQNPQRQSLTLAALRQRAENNKFDRRPAGSVLRYLAYSSDEDNCSNCDSSSIKTIETTDTGITSIPTSVDVHSETSTRQQSRPIRTSFVPLDLDTPLEEQHGGKFDVILHKLTEDILYLSTLSMDSKIFTTKTSKSTDNIHCAASAENQESKNFAAIKRVNCLNKYKEQHPECCILDDPSHVQILMSRLDIANVLSKCLVGVTSLSGIPVRTPKYKVFTIDDNDDAHVTSALDNDDNSITSYPVIAKPLQAAGTSKSHKMTVILNEKGLKNFVKSNNYKRDGSIATGESYVAKSNSTNNQSNNMTEQKPPPTQKEQEKQPKQKYCLLQEYENHNAVLYKVYVLGDTVRVYRRPSLPNLPITRMITNARENDISNLQDEESHTAIIDENHCGFVEFDSQRPYPKLTDFGIIKVDRTFDRNEPLQHQQQQQELQYMNNDKKQVNRPAERKCSNKKRKQGHHVCFPPMSSPSSLSLSRTKFSCSTAVYSQGIPLVTADEIRPVVNALKSAFQLELFGFDILVATKRRNQARGETTNIMSTASPGNQEQHLPLHQEEEKEMLVVDVNYFPSYKEVSNFPSMLAQFLTQRSIESRLKQQDKDDKR